MSGLVRRTKRAATRQAQSVARRAGFELLRQSFYNPLPDVERLAARDWNARLPLFGVDLRLDAATELVERDLRPYLSEFQPPLQAPTEDSTFFVNNKSYETVDAETLYAMVRHLKPRRVVELGSGASTHVIAAAGVRNASCGRELDHVIFDPFPFLNPMGPVEGPELRRVRAEDIDFEQLALQSGDVLFVDTTHTVKTGGDVTRIFLELIPQLAAGVHIHIHDIFLPFDYPREWVVTKRRAWAEQYLLQAFLAFNDQFEVVLPTYALVRERPDLIAGLVASYTPRARPGAFWIRRVAHGPPAPTASGGH